MALADKKENLNWIIKDLLKGQESVKRLIGVSNGSEEAKALIEEILDTFSRVISALKTDEQPKAVVSSEPVDPKNEISNKKRKGIDGSDKRTGARRSTRQASTRIIQAKAVEDGQLWRKYGQKEILNSKFPRSYFRCTHKFDQGCKAQKYAQKSEKDPTMFIITYMGNHTCTNASPLPQIIQNFSHDHNSCLISFESNPVTSKNCYKPGQADIASPSFQPLKQDGEDDVHSNLTMADLTGTGGDSDPMAPTSEKTDDRGDVISGLNYSIGDLEMHLIGSDFEQLEYLLNYDYL